MFSVLCALLVTCHLVFGEEGLPTSRTSSLKPQLLNISRHEILKALKLETETLLERNTLLEKQTEAVRRDCDEKYQHDLDIYNDMLSKLDTNIPEISEMEEQVQNAFERHEELTHATDELQQHMQLLLLKKALLTKLIPQLKSEEAGEYYDICAKYGAIINYVPEDDNGLSVRSLSKSAQQMATVLFERKRIMLEIGRNKEAFQNQELTNYLQYFAGYCLRKLEHIKSLIDELGKYPTLEHTKKMKSYLEALKKEITRKEAEMKAMSDQLIELIKEVDILEQKYKEVQERARCFSYVIHYSLPAMIEAIGHVDSQEDSEDMEHSEDMEGSEGMKDSEGMEDSEDTEDSDYTEDSDFSEDSEDLEDSEE